MVIAFMQAEARAEFAERSVQKLQKEVDRLEGNILILLFLKSIIYIYFYYQIQFLNFIFR